MLYLVKDKKTSLIKYIAIGVDRKVVKVDHYCNLLDYISNRDLIIIANDLYAEGVHIPYPKDDVDGNIDIEAIKEICSLNNEGESDVYNKIKLKPMIRITNTKDELICLCDEF